jgi:glyoxylase-like metal-dependent hydrolase (beta-lactamase superfamily II)
MLNVVRNKVTLNKSTSGEHTMSELNLSRRELLKFSGLGAAALSFGGILSQPSVLRAQGLSAEASAFYRFSVGQIQLTVLQDGVGALSPAIFGANVTPEVIEQAVADTNLPSGNFRTTFNVVLMRNGDNLALIDTGLGASSDNLNQGRLLPTLALLGIAPEDITHVVISHFHPDHIGGLASGGTALYPNASVFFPQGDYDFMTSDNVPSGAAGIVSAAQAQLDAVGDRLEFYAPEAEIIPGLQAVAAPGHTPGHSAFLFASARSQMLSLVDSTLSSAFSVPNPTWAAAFDAIPDLAVSTRETLLARAADEQLLTFGYHFPFPGVGYIDRDGESFRFIQATA